MSLLKPKEFTFIDGEAVERRVFISKFDAMEGLEINMMLPASLAMSAIPKLGEYKISEVLIMKILAYVTVEINGRHIPMTTRELINNHLGDWEGVIRVILAEVEYNNSFFRNGTISDFFGSIAQKFTEKVSEIFTQSSGPSSPPDSPPSTNSAPSIP